jgi:DNA-binding GntR family transcriptional regulator
MIYGIQFGIPCGFYYKDMRTKAISDKAYDRLKRMILSNRLRPGQKLLDRDLAKELGVSRTPVREALTRLEQDGLVNNRAGKGCFVADEMDAKQIADLYDLREMLETHAIRLAAKRASSSDLEELERVLAKLDESRKDPARRGEEHQLDLRIHEIIARASHNTFLDETVVRLLDRMNSFIWIQVFNEDPEAAELSHREHASLLTLIREKRADEAETVVRNHTRTAKQNILKLLRARETFFQHNGGRGKDVI